MRTFGISFRGIVGGLTLVAGLVFGAPAPSFGAAAAAKGITSIAVKSTDPALRQITLAFDPTCGETQSYNIDAFQLSVHYDASKVTLVSTTFAAPFQPLNLGGCYDSTPTPGVSEVAGVASNPNLTVPGAVNLFYETFQLKTGVALNTALTFKLGADDDCDFLFAVNSAHPSNLLLGKLYIGPCDIESSTITTSIAPSSAPLPSGYAAGGATLMLGLAGAGLRNRGKRQAA